MRLYVQSYGALCEGCKHHYPSHQCYNTNLQACPGYLQSLIEAQSANPNTKTASPRNRSRN